MFIGRVFLFDILVSCSTYKISSKNENNKDIITYDSILKRMTKYEDKKYSTKEMLLLYVRTYLFEGLNSGVILKNEIYNYTYLFECVVTEDGKMQNVSIKNSSHEDSNGKCFIEYLMKMPKCEFWNSYTGSDKERTTAFVIPLHL